MDLIIQGTGTRRYGQASFMNAWPQRPFPVEGYLNCFFFAVLLT